MLLRFHKPEYEIDADGGTVTWPIDRGLLVARSAAGARLPALSASPRAGAATAPDEVTLRVSSEVVNFYPLIAGSGWFGVGWIYNQTQLRIHVIVTHAFLRSLANLDLSRPVSARCRAAEREAAISPAARR